MGKEIEVRQTRDAKLIDSLVKDKDVWPGLVDDSCPGPDEIDIASVVDKFIFLEVVSDGSASGVIIATKPNEDGVSEVHTILTATCRGRDAINAGKKAINWLFSNAECKRLESYCYSDSPHVYFFAKCCGFSCLRKRPHPVTRQGKPVDVFDLFLNNPTYSQKCQQSH